MKIIKELRRWMAVFLLIMLSIPQVALAAPIIDTQRTGSISIQKFAVENIEDYDILAAGEEQTVDNAMPLPNIRFTVTRVQDDVTNPAEAVPLGGAGAYSNMIATNAEGLAEFKDLALGTYLVHEEESAAVEVPVEDFLISVPMTNAEGTGWIYDVFVYPKNELADQPDIAVSVMDLNNRYASVDNGSDVKWILSSDITKGIVTAQQYEISVMLDQYLEYLAGSERVYYKDMKGENIWLKADTDYSVNAAGQLVNISVTEQGREKIAEEGMAGLEDDSAMPLLHTEFETRFYAEEKMLQEVMGTEITVTAELKYVNELGIDHTAHEDEGAYIYTGGLNLLKVDGRTGVTLEGARFKIYRTLEEANADENAILRPGQGDIWEVTTKADGEAGFYGLSYGKQGETLQEGEGIYYLVEVQAPSGYNLLKAPEAAEVNYTSHIPDNHLRIDNHSGFTLPVTGGVGTLIFTLIGLVFLILAIWVYKTANKAKHEK